MPGRCGLPFNPHQGEMSRQDIRVPGRRLTSVRLQLRDSPTRWGWHGRTMMQEMASGGDCSLALDSIVADIGAGVWRFWLLA